MKLHYERVDGYEVTMTHVAHWHWGIRAFDPRNGYVVADIFVRPDTPDYVKLREAAYVVGDAVQESGAPFHEWGTVAEDINQRG